MRDPELSAFSLFSSTPPLPPPTPPMVYSGATCTVCNVLHIWSREQKNEQQNNVPNETPNPKNNAAAGFKGPLISENSSLCGDVDEDTRGKYMT